MSTALVWELIRKNNCFLVKRNHAGGVAFSYEKGNLTGIHCEKQSGLAQKRAVDIQETDGGVIVSLKATKKDKINNPKKMWSSNKYTKDYNKNFRVRPSSS